MNKREIEQRLHRPQRHSVPPGLLSRIQAEIPERIGSAAGYDPSGNRVGTDGRAENGSRAWSAPRSLALAASLLAIAFAGVLAVRFQQRGVRSIEAVQSIAPAAPKTLSELEAVVSQAPRDDATDDATPVDHATPVDRIAISKAEPEEAGLDRLDGSRLVAPEAVVSAPSSTASVQQNIDSGPAPRSQKVLEEPEPEAADGNQPRLRERRETATRPVEDDEQTAARSSFSAASEAPSRARLAEPQQSRAVPAQPQLLEVVAEPDRDSAAVTEGAVADLGATAAGQAAKPDDAFTIRWTEDSLEVRGRVVPGSTVRLQGRQLELDAEGRFSERMVRERWPETLELVVVAPDGAESRRRLLVPDRERH